MLSDCQVSRDQALTGNSNEMANKPNVNTCEVMLKEEAVLKFTETVMGFQQLGAVKNANQILRIIRKEIGNKTGEKKAHHIQLYKSMGHTHPEVSSQAAPCL